MLALAALLFAEPLPPAAAVPPPHTYLKGAESRRPCGAGEAGEIVVCGNGSGERLRPDDQAAAYAAKPLRAEVDVGGGKKLSLHNEAQGVGGFQSNRAMVTLSVPLP